MRTLVRASSQYFSRDTGSDVNVDDLSFCYCFKMASKSASSGVSNDRATITWCGSDSNQLSLLLAHSHDGTRETVDATWTSGYATFQNRTKYMASNAALFDTSRNQYLAGKLTKSTGALTIYIDGTALDSGGGSGSGFSGSFSTGRVFQIGRWAGATRYFDGSIGRVCIWSGTLLTDAQLQALSRGKDPRSVSTPTHGVPMRYTNQSSSSNENDYSGNAYTVSGTPAAAVDPYGLIFPPVAGRLQNLAARMRGGIQ